MSLKNVGFAAVVCLFALAAVAQATPISIDIANPGFDAGGAGDFTNSPTGWTTYDVNYPNGGSPNAGALDPVTWGLGLSPVSSPDVGYFSTSAGLGQLLKVGGNALQATAGDQIGISLSQGLRGDAAVGALQDLQVQLWTTAIGAGAGGSLVDEVAFSTVPTGPGTWVQRSATFTIASAAAGKNLYLLMFSGADSTAQIAVDSVSGTYTANAVIPEPGTLILLATGLIGLLAYAWRRRR